MIQPYTQTVALGQSDLQVTPTENLAAVEAALREAHEEIGMDKQLVTEVDLFIDDHGPWKYETVIAKADPDLVAHEQNDESLQVEWIAFDEVTKKVLHPSFEKTWPALLAILQKRFV